MKIAGPFVVYKYNIFPDLTADDAPPTMRIAYRRSVNDGEGFNEFAIDFDHNGNLIIWADINNIGLEKNLQEAKELLDKYLIENDYKICETDEEFEKLAILI